MRVVDAVAGVMFAAVLAYAVLGGADFGSGVWDLWAGGDRRGGRTRRLIDHAIGPVWEANHVWLVFVLVFLWSGFPTAFGAIMRSLAVPFWLVALGIVARGAGFAFRHYSSTLAGARLAGASFAISSLVTPFFMGTIVGAVASGRVGATGTVGDGPAWWSVTSVLGGVLAVLTCTFLAGVFLAREAERIGHGPLAESIRRRSIGVGIATGAVAVIGIWPLWHDAETLGDRLVGRALPLVALSAVAGLVTVALLVGRRLNAARFTAVAAVAAVVAGWGVAQYPWILVDEVRIDDAAGARATLVGLLAGSAVAAVLVIPPLVLLFVLADANRVGSLGSPRPLRSEGGSPPADAVD